MGHGGDGGAGQEQDPLADCIYILNGRCLMAGPGHPEPVESVTLADIEQFRPEAGIDSMEPNGWAIVDLDANFFATSSSHVIDGALFGQAASVRFTPVAWRWDYGDGTSLTAGDPGASWEALGLGEFDPTPTSHVYRLSGTYSITLHVEYAVEYRFATSPWVAIVGTLSLATNTLEATVGDAQTVLVDRDCGQNRAGPGC
jgi:hypothetical protein